jgi:hypothetical protein
VIDDQNTTSKSINSSNIPSFGLSLSQPNTIEAPSMQRYGFAYGTLESHVENGEGRFMIEWDTQRGDVYFDILEFSQPQAWFTRIGYPFARYVQKTFARSSAQALADWVKSYENNKPLYNSQEAAFV